MLKLRFALVGSGNIAQEHVKALLSCEQELVAICNHNLAKAQDFVNTLHLSDNIALFDNVTTMLDNVKIDVLYITTPHITHADIAFLALRRGIHCIIEKPLDISLAKALYLKEESERTGALVSVIAQSRFFPCVERIKDAIDNNKLDKVSVGNVNVSLYRDEYYYTSNAWRGKWQSEGGGVLVNQAVHELDLLCYFLGDVASVYGKWSNINHPYIEVDDTALALVKFTSGAMANIFVSTACSHNQYAYVHVLGSNGHCVGVKTHEGHEENAGLSPLKFTAYNDVFTLIEQDKLLALRTKDEGKESYYYFKCQILELLSAIENKANNIKPRIRSNIDSALNTMLIFNGIYLSQQHNKELTRDEIIELSALI